MSTQARANLKKAIDAMTTHKRCAQAGGAEWRGTWDNGHWCGHNSVDLNRIYTNLYLKVQQASNKLEAALDAEDPYRKDLNAKIKTLIRQRKGYPVSDIKFDPVFDRLVMVVYRHRLEKKNPNDHDEESLYGCTHYFQGRKVPCDCIADEIGFLSLSPANEERLVHDRLCFIGEYCYYGGVNWGKPIRGPTRAGKDTLCVRRYWIKECKNLKQVCNHYFQPRWNSPREDIPCDCIKKSGLHHLNPDNIYIKNCYYNLDESAPITISRHYMVSGVDYSGSDTFETKCSHFIRIEGSSPDDFSDSCDCYANGELSDKMKKFDAKGLIVHRVDGNKLNAKAKITICRETRGLIPHPAGHCCRHIRDDGGMMDCDCIPLFRDKSRLTDSAYDEVLYELSDAMKKRQEVGRVILENSGKITIGGFFKNVFMSSGSSYDREPTPYNNDKYVVQV